MEETKLQFDLKLDAEQVQKTVAQAVMDSALKPELDKVAAKVAKEFCEGWGLILQRAVEAEANRLVSETIRTKYKEQLEQAVERYFDKEKMDRILEIFEGLWNAALNKIEDTLTGRRY